MSDQALASAEKREEHLKQKRQHGSIEKEFQSVKEFAGQIKDAEVKDKAEQTVKSIEKDMHRMISFTVSIKRR